MHRVYTNLAVLAVEPSGLRAIELAPGVDAAMLAACTGAPVAV